MLSAEAYSAEGFQELLANFGKSLIMLSKFREHTLYRFLLRRHTVKGKRVNKNEDNGR